VLVLHAAGGRVPFPSAPSSPPTDLITASSAVQQDYEQWARGTAGGEGVAVRGGMVTPTLRAPATGLVPAAPVPASVLAAWGLVVLAVVLPGLVPVLASYGAAHGRTRGPRRTALHALLFALPTAGLWLATGGLVHAAHARSSARSSSVRP
jgi:predicted metal-binding membrane protein